MGPYLSYTEFFGFYVGDMGTQEIAQCSFSPLFSCIRNQVKVNTEGPKKGKQFKRCSVYVNAGAEGPGKALSLCGAARGARLMLAQRWDGEQH